MSLADQAEEGDRRYREPAQWPWAMATLAFLLILIAGSCAGAGLKLW